MSKVIKSHQRISQQRIGIPRFLFERKTKASRIKEVYAQYLELKQDHFQHFVWLIAVILAMGSLLLGLIMITQIRRFNKETVFTKQAAALPKG